MFNDSLTRSFLHSLIPALQYCLLILVEPFLFEVMDGCVGLLLFYFELFLFYFSVSLHFSFVPPTLQQYTYVKKLRSTKFHGYVILSTYLHSILSFIQHFCIIFRLSMRNFWTIPNSRIFPAFIKVQPCDCPLHNLLCY